MEFVEYGEILPNLQKHGLVEVSDDAGLIRLEMDPSPKLATMHVASPESTTPPYPDVRVVTRGREELAEILEGILNKLHLTEVLVIPVSTWRAILDCVAYDLAADEEWQEMDATSALHQNTRNALAVTWGETRVLVDMTRALLKNGDSARQDFVITSDFCPLLIEVFADGAFCITYSEPVIRELARSLGLKG